jgi:two-component system, NarL family, response regulator LiaR
VSNELLPISRDTTVLVNKNRKIRILLADGHHMVREGIRKLIESEKDLEVVGETGNSNDLCKLVLNLKPDVMVIEAHLPGADPVTVIKRLNNPEGPRYILILTSSDDESHALELLRAGANGCIYKTSAGQDLVQAIRMIRAGQFVCDPAIEKSLLIYFNKATSIVPEKGEQLSPRESEVLKLAAEGCTNRDIGVRLSLTEGTVKGYFGHIFDKMNVSSRTEAVTEGLKRGWVTLDAHE